MGEGDRGSCPTLGANDDGRRFFAIIDKNLGKTAGRAAHAAHPQDPPKGTAGFVAATLTDHAEIVAQVGGNHLAADPVSYTHLTLPTNREV